MNSMRAIWGDLVDLVVPRVCALCGELDVVVCEPCDLRIGEPGGAQRTLELPGGPVVVYSARAAGPDILRAITLFKDSGRSDLAPYLGGVLRSVSAPRDPVVDVVTRTGAHGRGGIVVTVPQSRRAYRRRGWNPVHTLARNAGFSPVAVLEVQPRHVDQTTLTRDARWHNVSHTVRVSPQRADIVRGRNVTVVDDVITTGATMSEVARALVAAGANAVRGVTLASVERLSPKLTGDR
jgi:predicted amidophosphoribosyltransferase